MSFGSEVAYSLTLGQISLKSLQGQLPLPQVRDTGPQGHVPSA